MAPTGQKLWWRDVLALVDKPESPSGSYIGGLLEQLRERGEVKVYSRLLREAVVYVAHAKGLAVRVQQYGPGWKIALDFASNLC